MSRSRCTQVARYDGARLGQRTAQTLTPLLPLQEYVVAHGSKIEQMTKVFHELDRDGSGALSFAEVTELARRFYDGRVPTEAKVKSRVTRFSAIDVRRGEAAAAARARDFRRLR